MTVFGMKCTVWHPEPTYSISPFTHGINLYEITVNMIERRVFHREICDAMMTFRIIM